MAEEVAEENTEPAGESQDDSSSDIEASPSADATILEENTASTDGAAEVKDADSDDTDSNGEADPINYDDLLVPDDMPVDEASLGEFKSIAAEMNNGKGLSQEDAQRLVDFRAKMVKESVGEWETTFSEWRGELLSDKEIGGDKFKTDTVPNVLAAAERFGDKDMLDLLRTNKLYGENPALVRMLNRVGETLRADQHARGRAAQPSDDETRLRRMYPSHYNDDGSPKNSNQGATS